MTGDQLLMYTGPYQDVAVYISVSNTWFGVGASQSTFFCYTIPCVRQAGHDGPSSNYSSF